MVDFKKVKKRMEHYKLQLEDDKQVLIKLRSMKGQTMIDFSQASDTENQKDMFVLIFGDIVKNNMEPGCDYDEQYQAFLELDMVDITNMCNIVTEMSGMGKLFDFSKISEEAKKKIAENKK